MRTPRRRRDTPTPGPPARRRFDWLAEPYRRRTALAELHRAVSKGAIDADGLAALVPELEALMRSGELNPRATVRVARIFLAIHRADPRAARPGCDPAAGPPVTP